MPLPEFDVVRVETTYADLRPTDRIVAKDGTVWPIVELDGHQAVVTFWLCDPVTKIKTHLMNKQPADPVTVERIPTHAEDVAKAEAEFPEAPRATQEEIDSFVARANAPLPDAVELVKEELGAVVTAEVTAEEVDGAKEAAATDTPVEIIPFTEMTPLEQRSHLYLLHGVFAHDLQGRDELIALHDQAHADHAAGKLNARQIPHTHGVPK
jgi:hypothetical protein